MLRTVTILKFVFLLKSFHYMVSHDSYICVYVYVCICVCMSVYVYCMCTFMYVRVCVLVCVYVHTLEQESLANLANYPWFAKLKSSKVVITINKLTIGQSINSSNFLLPSAQKELICQTFLLPNFPALWYVCKYVYMCDWL